MLISRHISPSRFHTDRRSVIILSHSRRPVNEITGFDQDFRDGRKLDLHYGLRLLQNIRGGISVIVYSWQYICHSTERIIKKQEFATIIGQFYGLNGENKIFFQICDEFVENAAGSPYQNLENTAKNSPKNHICHKNRRGESPSSEIFFVILLDIDVWIVAKTEKF